MSSAQAATAGAATAYNAGTVADAPMPTQNTLWKADTDSGMLSGWGCETVKPAAPSASPIAPIPEDEAMEVDDEVDAAHVDSTEAQRLLDGFRCAGEFRDCVKEAKKNKASEDQDYNVGTAQAESGEAGETAEDDDVPIPDDDDLRIQVEKLSALLRDNGRFREACEEAFTAVAVAHPGQPRLQLNSATELQRALNDISTSIDFEEADVDEEEAEEFYDGPMDSGVFYMLAKEYYSSLARTLTLEM